MLNKISVVGGKPLVGEAAVSGSKNAALPLLAASLLVEGETLLHNVPDIEDVHTMVEILRATGARVEVLPGHRLKIDARTLTTCAAPYELVRKMRASFYCAGALLGRMGKAEVPLPGGCYIGQRPVNYHLEGFRALGAQVSVEHGVMIAKGENLHGGRVLLDQRFCSVGATVNVMLAASRAQGETVIENVSRDPDATECANFLRQAGVKIEGVGSSALRIEGVSRLREVEYGVIPDRIEAGTLMLAGVATRGEVTVHPVVPTHLEPLLGSLRESGVELEVGKDHVRARCARTPRAIDVVTQPYPGFPTDLQPLMVVYMCGCQGRSVVEETIFEGRLGYVNELHRMGANIRVIDQTAIVQGVCQLSGAPVEASDTRAGAALVVAGLVAKGRTEVTGAELIARGYEGLDRKLRDQLGALVVHHEEQPLKQQLWSA
jgi:UDP-N-acetylglucosamine 1-carboxyvinyltransferase